MFLLSLLLSARASQDEILEEFDGQPTWQSIKNKAKQNGKIHSLSHQEVPLMNSVRGQ